MPIRNKMAAFMRSMGCRLLASEVSTIFITVKHNPCIDLKRYVRALRRRPVKVLYPEDEVEKRTGTKQNNVRAVDQQSDRHQTYVATKSGGKNKQKAGINEFVNWDVRGDPKQIAKATTDKISVDDALDGLRYEKAFLGDKRLVRAVSVAHNVRAVDQQSDRHQTYVATKSGGKNKQKAGINEFVNWDVRGDPKQIAKATTDKISVDDALDGLRYEKAFLGDKRLVRAVSVARSRKFREQQGKVLLEGKRLICDALAAGGIPQILFFSTVERLCELPLDKLRRASLVKVKFEDIKMWSDLVTPQGVMAIFSRPDASKLVFPQEQRNQSVPLYLICDNVRDPGNVGTILRCAAAAGCHSVLLTKGCVDVWEPKVLRAAMGAHFRVPIIPSLDWEAIPKYLPTTATVHLADNCSGLETDGDGGFSGPPKKAGDYGWVSSRPNRKNVRYEEYGAEYESHSDEEEEEHPRLSLPAVESQLYHTNWVQSHTALVIGGETHGLSLEALQLAERTDGRRLCVPMVTGVDSLNCAIAAGILLYEGKRQLTILAGQAGEKSRIKMP